VLDSVAWGERLLGKLEVMAPAGSATVHPTCSARHLGVDRRLRAIAGALADDVVVPPTATCCGFAGDRGILHPELTESATAAEAAEVDAREYDLHLSSNRTCEIGMERATGRIYESFVFPLEELTRPQ
jgi:D-lactate dehydrogenase